MKIKQNNCDIVSHYLDYTIPPFLKTLHYIKNHINQMKLNDQGLKLNDQGFKLKSENISITK